MNTSLRTLAFRRRYTPSLDDMDIGSLVDSNEQRRNLQPLGHLLFLCINSASGTQSGLVRGDCWWGVEVSWWWKVLELL